MTLMAREMGVNKTENYRLSDWSEWVEAIPERARLFRVMQREYGGCVSMLYRDEGDSASPHGWIFEKRVMYEDSQTESYVRQVWIELADHTELCSSCGQLAHDHHHFSRAENSLAA